MPHLFSNFKTYFFNISQSGYPSIFIVVRSNLFFDFHLLSLEYQPIPYVNKFETIKSLIESVTHPKMI